MTYDNFTISAQEAILAGQRLAQEQGSLEVGLCHLMIGIIDTDEQLANFLFGKVKLSLALVKKELFKMIEKYPKVEGADKQYLSKDANALLARSKKMLPEWGDEFISLELMLLSSVMGQDSVAKIFADLGVTADDFKAAIKELRQGRKVTAQTVNASFKALSKFAINLNSQAENGELDPIVGRDEEIRRIVHILSRRKKNNPILVGDAGVGKTSIVEGIAWRIVKNDVPEVLKTKQIYVLDLASLVAGAKYKGEFEERIKAVIEEVKASNGEVILFIDEIHSLIGAGGGNGAMDAANILKPALARGELLVIGSTTPEEYQKYFESDKALVRRFQNVNIEEPSIDETISILRGIQEKYEIFHNIGIKDEALKAAAELSSRYITERRLPDKAIDLIDEAASKLRLELDSVPDEIDQLQRKIQQLEVEKVYISRESDTKKQQEIGQAIADTKATLSTLTAAWKTEKGHIENIQNLRKSIETVNQKIELAERDNKVEELANLKGKEKPALEEKLAAEEKFLASIPEEKRQTTDEVTYDDIAAVVSKWTGIPITKMMQTEKNRLLKLEEEIGKRLIGQKEAVVAVCDAVRRSRAGLQDPNKPVGSFIFLGPTGVGKTELAKALAEVLFDDENAITRIDMSEYQEKHSVSRLVGAPPGYVGYDEGGQLTEAVRRRPYTIVLLDEIEKAHPDTFNILLQLLDDGRLTDNKGRVANFRNTIIIMTSNMGSDVILENFEDLDAVGEQHRAEILETTKEEVLDLLKENLRPEFLNRIDDKIVFLPLTKPEIKQIAVLSLKKVSKNLALQQIKMEVSDSAMDLIVEMGYDPVFGARPLKRIIDKELVNHLAKEILSGDYKPEDTVYVSTDKNGFVYSKSKPANEEKPINAINEKREDASKKKIEKLKDATEDVEKAVKDIQEDK